MNTTKPRVSIGLPVFNGENYLAQTLDSLLAQTYSDFELIISDNASTDSTEEICRAYMLKDERIRYARNQQNVGGAGNYNRVFELATGEYFKWAGHDDLCDPKYLEMCVEVLDQEPAVVACYGKTTFIDGDSQHIRKLDDKLNLRFPQPSKRFSYYLNRWLTPTLDINPIFGLIRADVLKKTPLIAKYEGSDVILMGEIALRGEIHEIPEYLFFRRIQPQDYNRSNRSEYAKAIWFDPANRGKAQVPRAWRWLFEYLKAIKRVPMSRSEKRRCYLYLRKWFVWYHKDLAKGLILFPARVLRRDPTIDSVRGAFGIPIKKKRNNLGNKKITNEAS